MTKRALSHNISAMKNSRRAALPVFAFCILGALCFGAALYAQQGMGTDINALNATESFRIGLEAYNRHAFNESITALEQALSYKPGEGLILDWLAKAYYRSGFEEIAIRQWQAAVRAYPPASPEAVIINSRIERVRGRRGLFATLNDAPRYVETGVFPGKYDNTLVFGVPSSMLACDDGSVWVAAYGTNEIVRLDTNGIVRVRRRGPLNGFDRPYDIARGLDGRLYVSEFRGGRVSVLSETGEWLSYIGGKGIADGELVGPAAISCDEEGYIYVMEFGNRRVSKFDPDGAFINSFGRRSEGEGGFPGFLSPTGLIVRGGVVFAADSVAKKIYMFSTDGVFLGTAVDAGLNAPESLRLYDDGTLLVSDTNRILLADPDSGIVKELTSPGNSRIRYICAGLDRNGAILAANFIGNEISVLASAGDVAAGFFVRIDRIINDKFPQVSVELAVEDSSGRPVVGLDVNNFVFTERGYPVGDFRLLGAGDSVHSADVSVLIERSPATLDMSDNFVVALNDIVAALGESGGRIRSIISARETPERERFNTEVPSTLAAAVRRGASDPAWRFDLGLRLAATDLLPLSPKRAVILLSSGSIGEAAFEQYALSELTAYLSNNNIVFFCVLTGEESPDDALRYIVRETGGRIMRLYRPEGIGGALKSLSSRPSPTYAFSYRSGLQTDFGRAFLPISAEVRLLERSGRDDSGYFPPLE